MDFYSAAIELHALQLSDWTLVVAGITIVLGMLSLLIFVFRIFGSIMEKASANSKKKVPNSKSGTNVQNSKPIPAVVSNPPVPVVEQGISGEVVAVISAAVYTVEGNNSSITSIKTVRKQSPVTGRNPWSQAAVTDNTRPF